LPVSFSYGPLLLNDAPSKVGDSTLSMSMRVMRAYAGTESATPKRRRLVMIVTA
jgi:hypothetical protein